MELNVIKFMKENKDWREQLKAFPYRLNMDEDDNYVLLKYNQIESDFNLDIVKECRGLIVNKHTLEPVALSFKKFFNVQEQYADSIDWDSAIVTEKADGSKILVWYCNIEDVWKISTSGKLDAREAPVNDFGLSFSKLFCSVTSDIRADLSWLDKSNCYTFELIGPTNRVVVDYKEHAVVLIGARNTTTFEEINIFDIGVVGDKYLRLPKTYTFSNVANCIDTANKLSFDEEGYVVVDKYWNRIKIKSPAYVAAHYLRENGVKSYPRVLEIIEKGEMEEYLSYFQNDKDIFEEVKSALDTFKESVCKRINEYKVVDKDIESRRDKASFILKNYNDIAPILFNYLDYCSTSIPEFVDEQWGCLSKDAKLNYLNLKN